MMDIRFDDRSILVTGARRGMGAAYAALLRERGARLFLNDLDGEENAGAQPVPDGDVFIEGSAVEGGDLVDQVIARSGRIDALVLNAGFLRDRSFAKADEADFRDLLDVHLIGPWRAARRAWPAMAAQGFGRIVFTTSPAGIYGNFGQSAYSAAKSALIGLTRSLAIEGQRLGITVNCVAPLAASRLSEKVIPAPIAARLPPQSIAALVAFLCHPSCTTTGGIYEAAGGSIARQVPYRGADVFLGQEPSIEAVSANWAAINTVAGGECPTDTTDALVRWARRWPDAAELGFTA